jgi:hypothetical protein
VAKQKVNPWAICHAQLGKEKTDKFERCVMKIKAKHGIKEMVNRYLNKRDLREKVILLGKAKEREQAKEIAAVHQKPTKHQQTVQQITRAGKMGSGKSHGAGERTARAYLKKDHTEYEGPTLAETKDWIQGAEADIKRRGTEGKCTPITKPGCTGKAKALAKTFKKMAKQKARGK